MTSRLAWMACLPLVVCGCAQRGDVELLEAQLRTQQATLQQLQTSVDRAERERRIAEETADRLRTELANRDVPALRPEQHHSLVTVDAVTINRLLTGGLDGDGEPGDDLLSVNLLPVDKEGDLLKIGGEVELELLDLSQPRGEQSLGHWSFDSEELRAYWHRGLVSSGYLFKLPWQSAPTSERLLLSAKLRTPDGREFHTSEEISIDPTTIAAATPQRSRVPERLDVPDPLPLMPAPAIGESDPHTTPTVDDTPPPPIDLVSETVPFAESEPEPMPQEIPFGSAESSGATTLVEASDATIVTDVTVPQESSVAPTVASPPAGAPTAYEEGARITITPAPGTGPQATPPPRMQTFLPTEPVGLAEPEDAPALMTSPGELMQRSSLPDVLPAVGSSVGMEDPFATGVQPANGSRTESLRTDTPRAGGLRIIPASGTRTLQDARTLSEVPRDPRVGDEVDLGGYPPRPTTGGRSAPGLRIIPGTAPASLPVPPPIRGPIGQ